MVYSSVNNLCISYRVDTMMEFVLNHSNGDRHLMNTSHTIYTGLIIIIHYYYVVLYCYYCFYKNINQFFCNNDRVYDDYDYND